MTTEHGQGPRGEGPANPLRISCADAVELGTLYLDGALGAHDREDYEVHLSQCNPCSVFLAQLRRTAQLTGGLATDGPTDRGAVDELARMFTRRRGRDPQ